ncbi:MAG: hypothetical protein J1F35_05710 [Erysipelotrichales bacterium]|nr:hypothetical protein [Erysipelotrichales bacterium]
MAKISVCEDIGGFYLYNPNEIKISGKAERALIELGEKVLEDRFKDSWCHCYGDVDFDIEVAKREYNVKGAKLMRDCVIVNKCRSLEDEELESLYEDIDEKLKEYIILDL